VNTRGTYMTSKAALPFLLKASNPHILTLSPPLSLNPKWFAQHSAYTIAKYLSVADNLLSFLCVMVAIDRYGMSMCVLGMSGEFKKEGVAVNALWPRTTIATAAVVPSVQCSPSSSS